MTDSTARLGLPYILTGQAQKEVTHNEALHRLDAVVQLAVLDRDLTAPPASPAEASAYLVAAGASGLWLGKDGQVAAYYAGWQFLVPREGWLAWVTDEGLMLRHTGTGWTAFASALGQDLMAVQDEANARTLLGLGSAALLDVGTMAGNAVQLDGSAKLPAVDGSQLLNLPGGGGPLSLDGLTDVDTTTTPPSDGQALVWFDSASQWKPGTVSGGGSGSYQPLDADLTALAGLSSTGLIERTGSGTMATAAVGVAGKALLDAPDAATQRATLGLGSAATLNAGTVAGAVIQLDAAGKLPAVDGSQLLNLPSGADQLVRVSATDTAAGLLDTKISVSAPLTKAVAGAGGNETLALAVTLGSGATEVAAGNHGHAGIYQSADATLTALAGVSATADTLPYFSGIDTAAATPLTSFARTILDDTDAATTRTTLGAAALSVAQTFSGGQRATVADLSTQSATITADFATACNFRVILSGNANFASPSNLGSSAGQSGFIRVTQDATGGRVPTYNVAWKPAGGSAPTLSTAANASDLLWYYVAHDGASVAFGLAAKGV